MIASKRLGRKDTSVIATLALLNVSLAMRIADWMEDFFLVIQYHVS